MGVSGFSVTLIALDFRQVSLLGFSPKILGVMHEVSERCLEEIAFYKQAPTNAYKKRGSNRVPVSSTQSAQLKRSSEFCGRPFRGKMRFSFRW